MVFGFKKKEHVSIDTEELKNNILSALRTIFDPEIPVNIYDLGLIYDVNVDAEANVKLQMTLTTPGCPVAQTFPMSVESTIRNVIGVNDVLVELVWEPPWTQDRMSEAAKLQLGML